MDVNTVRGLLTLVFLIAFVAIVCYAWSARNRQRFDDAAQVPFEDNGN